MNVELAIDEVRIDKRHSDAKNKDYKVFVLKLTNGILIEKFFDPLEYAVIEQLVTQASSTK